MNQVTKFVALVAASAAVAVGGYLAFVREPSPDFNNVEYLSLDVLQTARETSREQGGLVLIEDVTCFERSVDREFTCSVSYMSGRGANLKVTVSEDGQSWAAGES